MTSSTYATQTGPSIPGAHAVLSADQFTWDGRKGYAEASDLGFRAGVLPRNLLVRSHLTGAVTRFEANRQEIRDGDLLWTRYLAVVNGLFVILDIFND